MIHYGSDIRKKEFKGKCIIVFVDFLGFSNEIRDKWDSKESNPLDRLLHFVKNVNNSISRKIRTHPNHAVMSGDRYTLNGCRISVFSDSTIIAYCYEHEPNSTELLIGSFYILQTVISVWTKALDVGFTIRGGIEIGDIYWGNGIITGPSFIDAYELESKKAETSRVILGNGLIKKLKDSLIKRDYDYQNHPRAFYANIEKRICRILLCDSDNRIIISPYSLYNTEKEKYSLISKLEEMQKDCKEMKGIIKYTPLLEILKNKYPALDLQSLGVDRRMVIQK